MTTISEQIHNANGAICQNIELYDAEQRALLSQNLLAQLRNLVEGIAVCLHMGTPDAEFNYDAVKPGLAFIKSQAKFNFLGKLHKLIQISTSHYTMDGDASERLMLKYYEYLLRIRILLQENCGIEVLANLESFPVDLDPSLREYHEKIAGKIDAVRLTPQDTDPQDRFYIHKTRPFFVGGRIYYEVTFYRAINKVSKFDRIIAFTDIDMTDKYSAMLSLRRDSIEVIGQVMPITIIREWSVSIRPCEFNNFARLMGVRLQTNTSSAEYRYLMHTLTVNSTNLLDIVDMPEHMYATIRAEGIAGMTTPRLFPVLDEARGIINSAAPGHNILRYLMLRMHNNTLKQQYYRDGCNRLSDMKLSFSCIPFDSMPFCTSPRRHNPRYWDLAESLDLTERKHELLARRVKNNVERRGILYTPVDELKELGDVNELIAAYNQRLYYKHTARELKLDKGHVFIKGYENETVSIVEKLQECTDSGISGYTEAVERWLDDTPHGIDDLIKSDAIKLLFKQSRVALVYGAAGTGKSTMVDHIAHYFNDKKKLFLAHTNPAIDNLKRKVTAQNSDFRTINRQIRMRPPRMEYDLLIIDECSTVSNTSLINVLKTTSFKLLVLVGDAYQIESIEFGNWFEIIPSFIPKTSVFELITPYRTTNDSLLNFWNKVRYIEDDIAEVMAHNGYSTMLDKSLFELSDKDEIILCLTYDGLYGINNINRFLQSSNSGDAVTWRESTYKVGDPVLFHETERFRPVIYNNLKGWIVAISHNSETIAFEVKLDRPLTEFDVNNGELEWVGDSTVRFYVNDSGLTSDEDDDSLDTTVPFQVAYAVSIHKAQGLEYDSVKIVITDANESDITHNIFYTAVTRARERLRIFWTPETQQEVLQCLHHSSNTKDVALLTKRRDLKTAD